MSQEELKQLEGPKLTLTSYPSSPPKELMDLGFATPKLRNKLRPLTNDHEIYLDSNSPLILLSDTNTQTPASTNIRTSRFISVKARSTNSESQRLSRKLSRLQQSQEQSVASELEDEQSELTGGTASKKPRHSIFSPDKPLFEPPPPEEEEPDLFKSQTKEKKPQTTRFKKILKAILKSKTLSILMALLTLYALIGDNFRIILFTKPSDMTFDILTLITLGFFAFELILNFYVRKEYRWSFFFWLDLISTLSLVLDVNFISSSFFPDSAAQTVQIARASRASRIGTKAGRIVRIVRLVRLAKLYKEIKKNDEGSGLKEKISLKVHPISFPPERPQDMNGSSLKEIPLARASFSYTSKRTVSKGSRRESVSLTSSNLVFKKPSKDIDEEKLKESKVGKKLSELTTKRVIIIVLAMLLLIPLFSSDFYFSAPPSDSYEMSLIQLLFNDGSVSTTAQEVAITTLINQEIGARGQSLVYMVRGTTVIYEDTSVTLSNLRDDELETIQINLSSTETLTGYFSSRDDTVLTAWLDLGRTIFTCIVLTVGSMLFSKDANNLVLRPIERMIEKVNKIAKNPLIAKEQRQVRDGNAGFENETILIENAITKIGGLLALGFGDAGSAIIANNMAQSGDLNPMLAGKKRMAVFGFCDIRNFTDATEVLQQGVMVFVNSIAEIVHSMVDKYTGAANKNIGDAFLLVWKFPEVLIYQDEAGNLDLHNSLEVQNIADFSLISFLKIYARINRDPTLLEYSKHPGLNARLPNYKVKMGFGLHVGWAIEGAIGSEFKIDASYLSPNVNMASRLEAATKQYGVPLLFSGELYKYLSIELRNYTRLIDVVTVKGSVNPIEIYTVDMDVNDFLPSKNREQVPEDIKDQRHATKKELIKSLLSEDSSSVLLENDKELKHMFRNRNPAFDKTFKIGFSSYIEGDWTTAKKKFMECLQFNQSDGPTNNLMAFMDDHDFIAPENWSGYHVLTEKYVHMRPALFFFFAFGCIGITTEVFFTATLDSMIALQEGQKVNWRLMGYTYIWMFPIYGLAGILFPIAYSYLNNKQLIVRMPIYAIASLAVEFITGALLHILTGRCPWQYTVGWQVMGYIRLDYFPFWALFGLMVETIYLFLEKEMQYPTVTHKGKVIT